VGVWVGNDWKHWIHLTRITQESNIYSSYHVDNCSAKCNGFVASCGEMDDAWFDSSLSQSLLKAFGLWCVLPYWLCLTWPSPTKKLMLSVTASRLGHLQSLLKASPERALVRHESTSGFDWSRRGDGLLEALIMLLIWKFWSGLLAMPQNLRNKKQKLNFIIRKWAWRWHDWVAQSRKWRKMISHDRIPEQNHSCLVPGLL